MEWAEAEEVAALARQRDVLAHDFFDRIALDECIEKRLWEWHGSGPPFWLVHVTCLPKGPSTKRGLAEQREVWGSFKIFSPLIAFGNLPPSS